MNVGGENMYNVLMVIAALIWIGTGLYTGYRVRKICDRMDKAVARLEEEHYFMRIWYHNAKSHSILICNTVSC